MTRPHWALICSHRGSELTLAPLGALPHTPHPPHGTDSFRRTQGVGVQQLVLSPAAKPCVWALLSRWPARGQQLPWSADPPVLLWSPAITATVTCGDRHFPGGLPWPFRPRAPLGGLCRLGFPGFSQNPVPS